MSGLGLQSPRISHEQCHILTTELINGLQLNNNSLGKIEFNTLIEVLLVST